MRATRIGVPLLLACLVLLPACGSAEPANEPGPTDPAATAVPTPQTEPSQTGGPEVTPTPPAQTPGQPEDLPTPPPGRTPSPGGPGGPGSSRPMTLSGTVEAGVEHNCFLLDGYLLVGGSPDLVRAGARVTVTGHVQPGLMTTCQQGIPFMVQRVEPA